METAHYVMGLSRSGKPVLSRWPYEILGPAFGDRSRVRSSPHEIAHPSMKEVIHNQRLSPCGDDCPCTDEVPDHAMCGHPQMRVSES
jgi:hypothetical protein